MTQKYCPKCFNKFDQTHSRCPNDGKKLISMSERDLTGEEIDERYKVLRVLGKGGMGVVYVAEQAMVGRHVALKVLRRDMVQDESAVKRFMTEARAIASLRSQHTITMHDFGVTDDGLLYYTMELLEGAPLSNLIRSAGPFTPTRAADIIMQACDSLEEAHSKEILHRDIKPDNLFVSQNKGGDHATVLDFGIAKLTGDSSMESITRTGMICGTPQYLSPEQAMGNQAVPASDLYSLAIVFYEMLAGTPPFHDTTPMKVLLQHLNDAPVPVSIKNPDVQVPEALNRFLLKALSKEPTDRFPSVPAFRDALETAMLAGDAPEDTSRLAAMATLSDGTRSLKSVTTRVTTDYDAAPGKQYESVDPTGETKLVESAADFEANLGFEETADADSDAAASQVLAASQRRGFPVALLAGPILLIGALVALVIWSPWSTSPPEKSADPALPAASAPVPEEAKVPKAESDEETSTIDQNNERLQQLEREKALLQDQKKLLSLEKEAAQAKLLAESEVRKRLEAEAKARAAVDATARMEAEAKAKEAAAAEAKAKAEAAAKGRAAAEAKAKTEAEAKAIAEVKAEAEAKAKAKAREKARAEAKAKAKAKAEAEAKAKAEGKGAGLGFRKVKPKATEAVVPDKKEQPDPGMGFRKVRVDNE